jgi:hypothetical protein
VAAISANTRFATDQETRPDGLLLVDNPSTFELDLVAMIEVTILIVILAFKFGPGLTGLTYDWLDAFLMRQERRFSPMGWTALLSLLLAAAAGVYANAGTSCRFLGLHYAALAESPFAFDPENVLPYRVLTPLISYLIGLRGELIIVTNFMITAVMTGVIYAYFRKWSLRPGDAFLAVTTIVFSLVALTSIHCAGYCDILTYLIMFLMWQYRRQRILFHLLFLVGLFNRESIAFILPWFLFISLHGQERKSLRIVELVTGFGLAIVVYGAFRMWVDSHMDVLYSASYYLNHLWNDPFRVFRRTLTFHGLGLFSVFKVLWIFPCAAFLSFWRNGRYSDIVGMSLLLFGAYAQLLMAGDTSRMFTLAFMIMIVSVVHLLETNAFRFREWAFWAVLFNLMVPQVYTAADVVEIWHSYLYGLIF